MGLWESQSRLLGKSISLVAIIFLKQFIYISDSLSPAYQPPIAPPIPLVHFQYHTAETIRGMILQAWFYYHDLTLTTTEFQLYFTTSSYTSLKATFTWLNVSLMLFLMYPHLKYHQIPWALLPKHIPTVLFCMTSIIQASFLLLEDPKVFHLLHHSIVETRTQFTMATWTYPGFWSLQVPYPRKCLSSNWNH